MSTVTRWEYALAKYDYDTVEKMTEEFSLKELNETLDELISPLLYGHAFKLSTDNSFKYIFCVKALLKAGAFPSNPKPMPNSEGQSESARVNNNLVTRVLGGWKKYPENFRIEIAEKLISMGPVGLYEEFEIYEHFDHLRNSNKLTESLNLHKKFLNLSHKREEKKS